MKKIFVAVVVLLMAVTAMQSVSAAPVTVQDSRGDVTLSAVPRKVVVLGYAEYDTLRALGVASTVVGAPKTNIPAYIGKIPAEVTDIGSLKEPNLEAIAELAPDLIIANSRTAELASELEKIAPVFVLTPDTKHYWQTFTAQNTALATLFGKEKEAQTYITELAQLINTIKAKNEVSTEKTLMLMLNEGNISAFSTNSRFALLYQILGFKSVDEKIEDSRHGQEMSYEGILRVNPDRIFYIDRTAAIGGDSTGSDTFEKNELLLQSSAGKNGKVTALTSDLWYLAGSGLESFRLQVEEIANSMK
ncbi:ABC transporter substrate-binding protein [Tuanshanicoccus lijuaniae]|uniref:siderophore ABC transporter substrate-binding protein n=1 Tax=Aerococcaceae bacterium zg-1292 TaxID=2774330 RepID=UPI0019372205|nr:ABC transporter substrate-binding protein [Aerococcaceae bacterium zg-1292]MBS4456069.1 ABC transporter substrate-binding protein [Aerococcaceae bacterium zg-A91]MBS4457821.1 ABC transporter substrate-binding protein [Aerococcaceae bacterium zg-BR33]QQA37662.1 ABC transporter substrate-binding protein [Aerococcaceae bacterium zg-1292]